MSDQRGVDGRQLPVRWTTATLTGGTLLSAACFVVGFALTVLGAEQLPGDPLRVDQVVRAAAALDPWGWSVIGVYLLMLTPPAGLVATFLEVRRVQPATALLTLVVLGVLAAATLTAAIAG